MTTQTTVTRVLVPEDQRVAITGKLFWTLLQQEVSHGQDPNKTLAHAH